ncbi:lipopolysaccharide biosynthesis protein [Sellimonas catena]|uniref:Oligosaccharide transporter n=1 Tax=Sellimonas catena TaxID=2994035 RepID=A0A9W6FJB5_9FIRM|nr:oligosaccharide flippase family protein [Sellimonas catena]GLG91658.1 oligosaccharide transporter [Sellimonas catena]
MVNNSRTGKSIRNLIFALGGQGIGVLLSMISRVYFVKYLSVEYVGLSGLFSNILTMLSLAELGIGPAMTYSLYKPLAEKDIEKIKSLMHLYKVLYRIVGITVFALGFIMMPFYRFLIKEVPDISNLDLIFFLYVANTGVSYFYSYRRSLVEADQNRYISVCFQYLFMAIMNVLQIIELIIFKSFVGYMIIQVATTWIQNVCLAIYAGKKYPFLNGKECKKVPPEDLREIKRNVGAMIFHKVGSMVVLSTDNILISRMLGLASAGLFANYDMITKTLNNVLYQVFNSIVASVGNLNASSDKHHISTVFKRVFFLDFWIYGFSSICLYILFNPFITIWIGEEYLLSDFVVITLVVKFYLYGMLKAVRTFRDAAGLYYADRYKPLFEMVINLVASILLVYKFGLAGIFIGTIISTLTTCFWVEPWILYKNCLDEKLSSYFIQWIKYAIYTVIAGGITERICSLVHSTVLVELIIKGALCAVIPNIIFIIFTFRSEELHYFVNIVFGFLKKKGKKK